MSELPAPHTWKAPHDPLCRQQHWDGGDCFDCRLIRKVRADQDNRECDHCTDLARLKIADLRAKVEALKGGGGGPDPLDWGWTGALDKVLALFDGGES